MPQFFLLSESLYQLFKTLSTVLLNYFKSFQFPVDRISKTWYTVRMKLESNRRVAACAAGFALPRYADLPQMGLYLDQTVQYVNQKAYEGTLIAHMDGGTPNIIIEIDRTDAWHFGYLVYFFEKACGISGYLLGVNPFNQPGVESYKKNMFALLGKPGYEEAREALLKRL